MHQNNRKTGLLLSLTMLIGIFFIPLISIATEIKITELESHNKISNSQSSQKDDLSDTEYESIIIDKITNTFLKTLTKHSFFQVVTPKTFLSFLSTQELDITKGFGEELLRTSIDDLVTSKISLDNSVAGILGRCALDYAPYVRSKDISNSADLLKYIAKCFAYTIQTQDNNLCSFPEGSKEKQILSIIFLKDIVGFNYLTANGLAAIDSNSDNYLRDMNSLSPAEAKNVRNCLYSSDLPDLYDCAKDSAIYYSPLCEGQTEWRLYKILVKKAFEAYKTDYNTDGATLIMLLTSNIKNPIKSLFYNLILDLETLKNDPIKYYTTSGILLAQMPSLEITPKDVIKKGIDTALKKIGDDDALALRYLYNALYRFSEASSLELKDLPSIYNSYKFFAEYLKGNGGIMAYNINAKTNSETKELEMVIKLPDSTKEEISQKIDILEEARSAAKSEEKFAIWRTGKAIIVAPFIMKGRKLTIASIFTILIVAV